MILSDFQELSENMYFLISVGLADEDGEDFIQGKMSGHLEEMEVAAAINAQLSLYCRQMKPALAQGISSYNRSKSQALQLDGEV